MTKDQQEIVSRVYVKFYKSDCTDEGWTDIDEQMSHLEYLEDNQLVIESAVLIQLQSGGQPKCTLDHPNKECFVPIVIEAVGYILDLYESTSNLHPKNKFILQYYLALSQVGHILY